MHKVEGHVANKVRTHSVRIGSISEIDRPLRVTCLKAASIPSLFRQDQSILCGGCDVNWYKATIVSSRDNMI